jgi:cell division protein FtsB
MSSEFIQPRARGRIPQRARARRRPLFKRTIWPILRVAILVALAAMLGRVVAAKVVRPFNLCGAEDREMRQVAAQLQSLRKENAALERQLHNLKTGQGVSAIARKLGYVKPGEVSLVIPE